jgi:hypothetical protein
MTSALCRSLAAVTGLLLTTAAAAACTTTQAPQGASSPSVTTGAGSATAAPPDRDGAGPTQPTARDDGSPTGADAAPKPGNQNPTTRKPTTSAKPASTEATAKVESLAVVRKPSCPVVGTPDAPYSRPGVDVVIAWKVTGAPGAALAVDNPTVYGAYGTYGATGQLELAFTCSGGTGTTSHTYTIWPQGTPGVSKTITVTAQNGA